MTCLIESLPKYAFLQMTLPCISQSRGRKTAQHFKRTSTCYQCGRRSGICSSIPQFKCQVVKVTGSKSPIKSEYILHCQVLETVTCARYLGVDIRSNISWTSHIDRVVGNANRSLGYIRRNIKSKNQEVRESAYNTLVRPQLEYASAVWDRHTKDHISKIEMVQRRAARWTISNSDRRASVTEMLDKLGWRTLEQRPGRCPPLPLL